MKWEEHEGCNAHLLGDMTPSGIQSKENEGIMCILWDT